MLHFYTGNDKILLREINEELNIATVSVWFKIIPKKISAALVEINILIFKTCI